LCLEPADKREENALDADEHMARLLRILAHARYGGEEIS